MDENQFSQSFKELLSQYPFHQEPHPGWLKALQYPLGPGKWVRPFLVYYASKAVGGRGDEALAPALAVELVHTYSLIHDDLPSMDNDEWRRGRATMHVAFDEATAILVGDGLLTDAFDLLADPPAELYQAPAEARLLMIRQLARASGSRGMVRGQFLDLFWEQQKDKNEAPLPEIHIHKTGRLMGAACALGSLAVGCYEQVETLQRFGEGIGLVFQMVDDCLDELPNTGKSQGKDREAGKLTYLSHLTAKEVGEKAQEMTNDCLSLLAPMGAKAEPLADFARQLVKRSR